MNTHNELNAEGGAKKSEVALREEAVQAFWKEHDIFKRSIETPAGNEPVGDFVFYDGPPFATGLPHYGHILAGTIKDAIPRFWTMNGYRVERKWGWDCHGLPLENLIEKKLGLATKRDIEEYGVKEFNEAARGAVLEYADDWGRIMPRMGRWADMEDDYKTMDASYTESVWWVFSELYKKGLVYEGFKSMHLCPRCGTTLSNFEVNQGYKDIKDISVFVELPLNNTLLEETEPTTSLLVWTTTPWTLPGNMAAAVHEEYEYAVIEKKDEGEGDMVRFVVAKDRLEALFPDNDYEIVKVIKGADLVGLRYTPPFDYWEKEEFDGKEQAWQILHADYVELGDTGTGAVHLAPAYGDDDMKLAESHGVPIKHHVDEAGHFMEMVSDFKGLLVKPKDDDEAGVTHLDSDIEIVKALKERGVLFKKENITHSYPHCWRCDTPLLNYATTSWFVEVTNIKNELVAANNEVSWVPEHVGTNRFGKWLEGARDWAVSRQRYWGAPLPIWRNPETNDIRVLGSLNDLQALTPKSGNTYTVMRHGEAESNLEGVVSSDVSVNDPLTETGIEQVKAAALELKEKNIDLIVASPFERTSTTATLVAETLGLGEDAIVFDERIQELQAGAAMQGKPWSEYHHMYETDEERFTKHIGDAENRQDVQRRAGEFLFELEETHQGKNILIVGHISSLYGLICASEGAGMELANELRATSWLTNAEVRPLTFTPFPHNDHYELDFHRPYIDDVKLFEDGVPLERVPDVFDCWFESGSMPYGQHHFMGVEQEDFVGKKFPAQFIAEGLDQTRGWFYSLIVLGTALFGKSPYENVIVNGLVLAEDGKKMSKSLQNYPDPMELADRVGVDAMRFYLLSSPIMKGEDLNFSEKEVLELQRKNIGRLHNVLAMYLEYADGTPARSDSSHVLDTWIIARLNELTEEVTAGFNAYELDRATRPITDFIDDLSVWYLRRSRDRLKQNPSAGSSDADDGKDKQMALATLRYVLEQIATVMAPAMPFYAEHLWQQVRDEDAAESVHLRAWPQPLPYETDTLAKMQLVRAVVSKALEVRAKAGVKVRQPLSTLTVNGETLAPEYLELIKDEVNVKEVVFDQHMSEEVTLDLAITPALQAEGEARDLIRAIQDMRKKTGLEASDMIVLTLQSSHAGEVLAQQFEAEIMRVTGSKEIVYGTTEGNEVMVGKHSFTIGIEKVG